MRNIKEVESLYQQAAFSAVANNDIDALKENLDHLMLLRKPNLAKDIFNKFKYLSSHLLELDIVKKDHKDLMQDLLFTSINNHHSEITQYLLDSNELLVKPDCENSLIWQNVFANGEVDNIKYLLSTPKIKPKDKARLVTNGMTCIKESNIEILEWLLNSSRPNYLEFIEEFNKYNRINSPIAVFNPFISACSQNSISLVDAYLNKDEIKHFINPITFHNGLLMAAYNDNSLDVLEHLLTSPNISIKLYKDYTPDQLIYMATLGNSTDILNFLIFDIKIKLEKNLDEILNIESQTAFNNNFGMDLIDVKEYQRGVENTKKLFATRDLKEQLMENLGSNPTTINSKKLKL